MCPKASTFQCGPHGRGLLQALGQCRKDGLGLLILEGFYGHEASHHVRIIFKLSQPERIGFLEIHMSQEGIIRIEST